jgi:hypothetical protein
METDPSSGRDQFGFRLEWPDDALAEPFEPRDDEAEPEQAAAAPPASAPSAVPQGFAARPPARPPLPESAAVLEGGPATLAAIAARVEGLTAATVTFRNALAGQVTEYTQRVSDAIAEQSASLELAIRGQHRAIGELTSQLHAVSGRLGEVTTSVDDLVQVVEQFRSDVAASLESISEEVRTLRRRTPVRPRAGRDDDQVDAATETRPSRAAPARRRTRQAE